jgi:hypothetical protein
LWGGVGLEELKYLEPTDLLEKIYATLCSEYEDEQHYEKEQDQQEIAISKKRLTKKVFNEFVVDEEYFLTMDSKKFKEQYQLFEKDFLKLITGCGENGIAYETFLEIIDDLVACAKFRVNAFEKLQEEIGKSQEASEEVEEDEE